MIPVFFKNQSEFREWLDKNHKKETELLVGFFKVASGRPNMSWSESVDQALCFGWIDGIRKSIDKDSYTIRFTPRKPTSNWSAINIDKVEELIKQGLMQEAGLNAYRKRKEEKSKTASYESIRKQLPATFEEKFIANKIAWGFFTTQAPSYQRMIIHWILTAKQEKTRLARLDKTIALSEEQKKIF
jgi:uncharacterized protein YdeI (YjbR/CyaY-like superfamily)